MTKHNPARLFLARAVYWSIWGPAIAVALPFALVGVFIGWLEWKAFPWIARITQPAWGAANRLALRCGNAVLGFKPTTD
jgi:hypothetical protein